MKIPLLAILISSAAFAQSPAKFEFEVASIRPSAPQVDRASIGVHMDGQMVRCNYLTLRDYVGMAYDLKIYQVQLPDGLSNEHYDIAAKLPEGAKSKQLGEMMQRLLADRFQLKFHRESKEFPVYALLVKNPAKLKESPLDAETADSARGVSVSGSGGRGGVNLNLGRGAYFSFADNRLDAKKVAMQGFADTLARFMDRPVVDMTGLKSTYDFAFDLAPEDYRTMLMRSAINAGVNLPPEARQMMDAGSDETLFAGLESVGLKLERRKAPLDVLVVDHAEKAPTAN